MQGCNAYRDQAILESSKNIVQPRHVEEHSTFAEPENKSLETIIDLTIPERIFQNFTMELGKNIVMCSPAYMQA